MPPPLSLCWLALGSLLAAVGSAQAKGGGGGSSSSSSSSSSKSSSSISSYSSSVKSPSKWTSNNQVHTREHDIKILEGTSCAYNLKGENNPVKHTIYISSKEQYCCVSMQEIASEAYEGSHGGEGESVF